MSDDIAEVEERGEYTQSDLEKIGAKWLERIRATEKRDEQWLKDAEAAEAAYLCDSEADHGDVPEFNILHSNVETIVPSIYNSTPHPDIRPRHNVKDPVGKAVADVLERAIATQIDDNALDSEVEASAQDAFMAGRGVVRVKFDADVIDQPVMMPDGMPAVDEGGEPVTQQVITNERVLYEVVAWKDYREGTAKRWRDVPWVAYRHCLSQEDLEKIEDTELRELQPDPENAVKSEEDDISVWEIWCKDTRKVYFICADNHKVLKVEEDPLGLPGFFPQAAPVQPINSTSKRTPVCPYTVYKTLAEELDRQTKRINAIVKGLKVRGAIAADGEAIELIAQAGDNEIVPIPNIENIAAAGGLEKAIMWWPIATAVAVLKELYVQREQTKQTIYEITGISDIVRGASNSGETATAQKIKTQWGSLRIKKMQRLIERQIRDLFLITAEIISRHFSMEAVQRASGIPLPPEAQQFLQKPLDNYRIDVESDSTVRADLTQSRQEMAEFLNGTAQFFGAMAPLVQQAPEAAKPIAEVYASFSRSFSLGKQAEDALDQLVQMAEQAASQPKPNPEMEKMKAEAQRDQAKMQMEMQGKQADFQIKTQEAQLRLEEARTKLGLEVERLKIDLQKARMDLQIKSIELALKEREASIKAESAAIGLAQKHAAAQAQ